MSLEGKEKFFYFLPNKYINANTGILIIETFAASSSLP